MKKAVVNRSLLRLLCSTLLKSMVMMLSLKSVYTIFIKFMSKNNKVLPLPLHMPLPSHATTSRLWPYNYCGKIFERLRVGNTFLMSSVGQIKLTKHFSRSIQVVRQTEKMSFLEGM